MIDVAGLTRSQDQAVKLAREARFVPGHERSPEALSLWDDVTSYLPRKGLESAWELAALDGHRDPVVAVAVSADGTRALSGDLTGHVRIWDLAARAPLAAHAEHEATVAAVAISPDARWGVSASWDRTLRLWPLADGGPARVLQGHTDYVNGVAVSPDGRALISASSDQTLRLWELPGGRLLHVIADGYFWDYVHLCTDPSKVDWKIGQAECARLRTSSANCWGFA